MAEEEGLFFDDDETNIRQVDAAVQLHNSTPTSENRITLQSIRCPPGKLQLILPNDKPISVVGKEDVTEMSPKAHDMNYFKVKLNNGDKYAELVEAHVDEVLEDQVGIGLSIEMIDKLIKHVGEKPKDKGLYIIFDFDKLLSQVDGLWIHQFAELKGESKITDNDMLKLYSKYLFSNYTGDEPDDGRGRMAKLKSMFKLIHNACIMVYVITNNESASRTEPAERELFVRLIQELYPDFNEQHLICSSTNANKNKGRIIVEMVKNNRSKDPMALGNLFTKGGMKRRTHRKTNRRRKSSSSSKRSRKHSSYKKRKYNKNKR